MRKEEVQEKGDRFEQEYLECQKKVVNSSE